MNDPDQTITWSRGDDLQGPLWADDIAVDERSAVDLSGGLVNLGFFTAALRRKAWVWCLTAVIGLVIGAGLYVKYPPHYHATATVLIVYPVGEDPAATVATEANLAKSQPVASRVVQALKLRQSVASFMAAYTVTVVTSSVLMFDIGAPSSAAAVKRVSALANAFIQYHDQNAQTKEQQLFAQLDQQYNAAQQSLTKLETQLNQISSPLSTPQQKAEYDKLKTQIGAQQEIITYVTSTKSSAKTSTNAVQTGSYVLDNATALPRSHIKGPVLYFVGGLFGGLVIGIIGVIIAALMSHRLCRRDDVAAALGAPVRLSVGPLRSRRWRWRKAANRDVDMRRVVAYLRRVVLGSSRGTASLAVVAIDDAPIVAHAVASLASSCAADGKRVVVADLSSGAHLAHLLGVSGPGAYPVRRNGTDLMVVLPEAEDVAPTGPVPSGPSPAVPAQANAALLTAYSSADLLLTLATLDPAFSGDYLGTWATSAVAVVTAGESTAEKIHSVGEMLRLAGTRLDSVVLIGADKRDESLGVIDPAERSALFN